MKEKYKTQGVCAPFIEYEIDDDKRLRNVRFSGGCMGNRQAIAVLVEGMPVQEAISKLKGIQCRNGTSCADQLAISLIKSLERDLKK